MKISRWLVAVTFAAPLLACSSDDSKENNGGSGGTGSNIGGSGGAVTGGSGGSSTGGSSTGGSSTGGSSTGGTDGSGTGGTDGSPSCTIQSQNNPDCTTCFQAQCENECIAFVPDLEAYSDCSTSCTDQEC